MREGIEKAGPRGGRLATPKTKSRWAHRDFGRTSLTRDTLRDSTSASGVGDRRVETSALAAGRRKPLPKPSSGPRLRRAFQRLPRDAAENDRFWRGGRVSVCAFEGQPLKIRPPFSSRSPNAPGGRLRSTRTSIAIPPRAAGSSYRLTPTEPDQRRLSTSLSCDSGGRNQCRPER